MQKLFSIILLLCFVSCGFQAEDVGHEPWPEDERQMFIENCVNRSTGEVDFDVYEYCSCMQLRIEERYRVDELGQITMIEMSDLAESCINEQEGHHHHHHDPTHPRDIMGDTARHPHHNH